MATVNMMYLRHTNLHGAPLMYEYYDGRPPFTIDQCQVKKLGPQSDRDKLVTKLMQKHLNKGWLVMSIKKETV